MKKTNETTNTNTNKEEMMFKKGKGHKHGVAAVLTIVAAVVIGLAAAFTWVYNNYDFKIEVVKRVPQERVFVDITVR